jgi:hypothetical protein
MNDPLGFINSEKWRFASTMRHIPHWYIVKEKVDQELFVELETHIRHYGRLGIWHNSYLHWYWKPRDHGFYYWTMGWPIGESAVVNRAKNETDDVKYLDLITKFTPRERELLEKWADWTECPFCRSLDPFALQWADQALVGIFCSSCRQRML